MSHISSYVNAVLLILTLLLIAGCENDTEIDVTDFDALTDQQLVDGTVIGLKRSISSNLNLVQTLMTSSDAFKEISALLTEPDTDQSQVLPRIFGGIQSSTGIDISLLSEVPELVEFVISNSTVTVRENNQFFLDPNEFKICAKLEVETQKQARCVQIIRSVQLDATVTELQDGKVVAADIGLNFNNDLVLSIGFSPTDASFEILLPGLRAALSGIREITLPGEPDRLPSSMLGSLRLNIAESPQTLALKLSAPQAIAISDNSLALPVDFTLAATNQLLGFNLDIDSRTLQLDASISEMSLTGFDQDDQGIFPLSFKTDSEITGSALISNFGKNIILTNVGLNAFNFSINNEPAINFSLHNFNATIAQNQNQRSTLSFDSPFQLDSTIANHRGYFSDLFNSNNPDLRRELHVSIDTGTLISRVSESVVKIEAGSIIAGLSVNNQDPLAIELATGNCLDVNELSIVACPLFTIKSE